MKNKIKQFINGQSRNKLIIAINHADFINPIDVGKLFSAGIKEFTEDKKLPMRAKEILEDIFDLNFFNSDILGKHLAIQNLAILFEPELKIDFLSLIDKYSRSNVLIMKWDGEIENNNLFFLTKEKGKKINIKNLSHITI